MSGINPITSAQHPSINLEVVYELLSELKSMLAIIHNNLLTLQIIDDDTSYDDDPSKDFDDMSPDDY